MLFQIIASYLPYTLVTAFTPGPNNIIALYAVSQSGWRKGKSVLLGIAVGFLCVMTICAVFCYELARYVPSAAEVLKYVGAAYILYLAYRTFVRSPGGQDTDKASRPLTCVNGFLLQFLNVKILMLGIAAYSGYILPTGFSVPAVLCFALIMAACAGTGNLIWATAGTLLLPLYKRHYKLVNGVMALLLLWCARTIVTL